MGAELPLSHRDPVTQVTDRNENHKTTNHTAA